MSTRYLLDTSTVVDVLRRRPGPAERLAQESPEDVAISAMVLAELLYGARCSRDPEGARLDVLRFAEMVHLLGFGRRAAERLAEIRFALRAQPIGPNDMVIAATALAAGATVVTNNLSEFERVPGLAVETWQASAASGPATIDT